MNVTVSVSGAPDEMKRVVAALEALTGESMTAEAPEPKSVEIARNLDPKKLELPAPAEPGTGVKRGLESPIDVLEQDLTPAMVKALATKFSTVGDLAGQASEVMKLKGFGKVKMDRLEDALNTHFGISMADGERGVVEEEDPDDGWQTADDEPVPQPEPEVPAVEEPNVTLDDIKAGVKDCLESHSIDVVRQIFARFGAERVSEIDEQDYHAVLSQLQTGGAV